MANKDHRVKRDLPERKGLPAAMAHPASLVQWVREGHRVKWVTMAKTDFPAYRAGWERRAAPDYRVSRAFRYIINSLSLQSDCFSLSREFPAVMDKTGHPVPQEIGETGVTLACPAYKGQMGHPVRGAQLDRWAKRAAPAKLVKRVRKDTED
jgi:hypothetical protein